MLGKDTTGMPEFLFHLDFDNLNLAELALMVFSLSPHPSFRFRLGLGKAIGLGCVKLDIEGVFFIDRHLRYGTKALEQSLYHEVWRSTNPDKVILDYLRGKYPEEADSFSTSKVMVSDVKQQFNDHSLIDVDSLECLIAVGDIGKLKPGLLVHTPLLEGKHVDPEDRTFDWFVENDKHAHQPLRPIQPNEQYLPTLCRNNER